MAAIWEKLHLSSSCNYLSPDFSDILTQSKDACDLGVIVNSDANFDDKINYICKSLKQKIG